MDTEMFWRLVEGARGDDRGERCAALKAALVKLPAPEIAGFAHEFDRQMARSYTWDLWGAAYILNGGCSDDGFDYFRSWLISLGRRPFELALERPETLAGLPEVERALQEEDGVFFEEFAYVAGEAHEENAGSPIPPDPSAPARPPEPAGIPWEEDGPDLERRFPRLWAKYGARYDAPEERGAGGGILGFLRRLFRRD